MDRKPGFKGEFSEHILLRIRDFDVPKKCKPKYTLVDTQSFFFIV